MDAPAVSLVRKMAAAALAFALALSMAPVAWADDAPAGTLAGSVAGSAAEAPGDGADGGAAVAPDDGQAPEAEVQSAEAKAADGTGSATGTTIKIAVYRSSYPLIWDLNDEGSSDVTKAQWDKPASWPTEGSPGSAVGAYAGYTEADEPTRTGFAFLGWSAVADDPTVAGKLDALEIPKGTEPVEGADGVKSITLHALWAPIEYSVVFDLTKNPEDASAVPSFSWTTGKGTFTDLGGGRYRLSGVTLEDYDPERGLIEIATPSRGTGGYRFLSWAEPESQQSPTVAMQPVGTSTWYVNPVALTHYDYEPVLTARWSLSFDVDVPSQITFDEYDSIEVEGSLTDTTDKDVVDEESPDVHDAGKMAHFCSQSTATDYKIVALKSEMQPTASDILTTSDSSKASQEQVLSDEKLLSLFAANATSESAGVHFRLTDSIDMDDSSRYGAFVIPKQTKSYSDADYSRDDEERLYVSYRLNLSNKVDGASEPNHGLVTPANVNEGDRTPIAKVSYEFAVADDAMAYGAPYDVHCLWTTDDDGSLLGILDIKRDAEKIAGGDGPTIAKYERWMNADHRFYVRWYDQGISEVEGGLAQGKYTTYGVRIIGLNHDAKATGSGTAGVTFQLVEVLNTPYPYNFPTCNTLAHATNPANPFIPGAFLCGDFTGNRYSHNSNEGGWDKSSIRARMNPGTTTLTLSGNVDKDDNAIWNQVPPLLARHIVPVAKKTVLDSGAMTISTDALFLLSYSELVSKNYSDGWDGLAQEGSTYAYWKGLDVDGRLNPQPATYKYNTLGPTVLSWWLRTPTPNYSEAACRIGPDGQLTSGNITSSVLSICPAFCL